MLLLFSTGQSFATGAAPYLYETRADAKLSLQVQIEGVTTTAVIDTGAPYLICNPELASQIDFSRLATLEATQIRTHIGLVQGQLFRMGVMLLAEEGNTLELQATAFVPDPSRWAKNPSFLGFYGCLERVRFAVDPESEKFYFGPL